MKRQLDQVLEFHKTFDVHIEPAPAAQLPEDIVALRARIMQEELDEYKAACAAGDLVEIADALTDMLYVVFGTIVTHGLQDVAEALFDEVHRSNMSKLDENGQAIHREDGKVLKSARFSEPDLASILARYAEA